ncbi:F-box domain-containing protein [Caenorhabditis elegans]|uniref:F-box domain-containing protein n=1 Tax=Caenorhabditis elegans TaxID=6239 RepID=G5EDI6_CAEEL|nr:F-box domain-containing protein [Caenorhabditis elegans]CAA16306.3 F-box domain-containing protein [Caenorhabditis elegans]|eukprot:NP_001256741.1 Uncharacterized protein CELE_Y20C6A.1 [Caenorhabditis elegans]
MTENDYSADQSQILQSSLAQLDAFQDIDVRLEIREDQIKLILETETPLKSGTIEVRNVWIAYRPTDNGCLIENNDQQEFVDRLEFFDVSVLHLEHALGTMDVLKKFSVISVKKSQDEPTPSVQDLQTNAIFLENLNRMLTSRQKPLNAFAFEVNLWQEPFNNHAAIMMSHLNSNLLNTIILSTPIPGTHLKLDAIVTLEQWLNGKEVKMNNLSTDLKFDAFFHFAKVSTGMYPNTYSELTLLKNHFLNHETPEYFELNYPESFNNRRVVKTSELFGKLFHVKLQPNGELYSKKWYFPVGDGEEFYVLVKYRPKRKNGTQFVFRIQKLAMKIRTVFQQTAVPNYIRRAVTTQTMNETKNIRISYKPRGDWCIIDSDQKQEVSQSPVCKVSVLHLEYLLRSIPVLWSFSIASITNLELDGSNEILLQIHKTLLDTVETMLRERSSKLKVNTFVVTLSEKPINEHLPGIMACLEPRVLKEIILTGDKGELHCDGLVNLEQWKNASLLSINNFYVKAAISNFLHFQEVRVTFAKLTYDDLIMLKEHFLVNEKPSTFELNFNRYAKTSEISNDTNNVEPHEVFGETEHVEYKNGEELYRKIWYFPHEVHTSYDLRIEYCNTKDYTFQFGFVEAEVNPQHVNSDFNLLSLISTNYQAMKSIIEKCSFVTILSLRKVCKNLRNFIDTAHFDFPERNIWITFDGKDSMLEIITPEGKTSLTYKKNPIGCKLLAYPPIPYGSDFIATRMMPDNTPLDCCMSDLKQILKHQKTPISKLAFTLRSIDDEYIHKLKEILKAHETPLKVKCIVMLGVDLPIIRRILSYLDKNELKMIFLNYDAYSRVEEEELDTTKLVELDQWKMAEELRVLDCGLSFSVENIGHFLKVEVTLRTISVEDLVYLKEIFKTSSANRNFNIKSRSFDAGDLVPTLGASSSDTKEGVIHKKWFFKMKIDRQRAVCIDYLERIAGEREITVFVFSHVEISDVPANTLRWEQ